MMMSFFQTHNIGVGSVFAPPTAARPSFIEGLGLEPDTFQRYARTAVEEGADDDWSSLLQEFILSRKHKAKAGSVLSDYLAMGFTQRAAQAAEKRISWYGHAPPYKWAIDDLMAMLSVQYVKWYEASGLLKVPEDDVF
jgi:hypothetical protein